MKQYKDTKYYITEDGNVFNIHTKKYISIITRTNNKSSYSRRYVGLSINKQQKWYTVARLVAEYYVQNPDNKNQVNHIDGNPMNDHYSNLEWCTQSENIKHAINIGLKPMKGESNTSSKLTNQQVLDIRNEYKSFKTPIRKIAKKYNVSYTAIRYIIKEYTWN